MKRKKITKCLLCDDPQHLNINLLTNSHYRISITMQGGIRRKKDLLPRYKHNGNVRSKAFLTTPMKKILAYVTVLLFIFFLIRTGYSDFNKVPDYELDGNFGSLNSKDKHSNDEMLNNNIVKEKFNNEVAMQQETKNLENDITKPNRLKDKLSNKNAQLDA